MTTSSDSHMQNVFNRLTSQSKHIIMTSSDHYQNYHVTLPMIKTLSLYQSHDQVSQMTTVHTMSRYKPKDKDR